MSYFRSKTLGRYGKQLAPPTQQAYSFPASVGGVNAIDSLMMMPPQDAIYTYNLMPSEYGLRLRKGYKEWATGCKEEPPRAGDQSVRSIIPFESNIQSDANDRLFAVTAEGIWDVTTESETVPDQVVDLAKGWTETGDTSGYGVWTEFTGDAAGGGTGFGLRGHYLFYADGLNGIWQYEESGDVWSRPPSGTAATDWHYKDGTGTDTAFAVEDVAFVMVFKQRIWVILEDEDDAWYLPVASVTGELKRFTFGSKMPHGGNLMGLWNWTVDGGDGVDDMMVAISRGGDVIIYQGEDPELTPSGSTVGPWSTRGAWYVGEIPESRRIVVDYGPDLYVLSTYGLTSLNDLLRGNPVSGQTPSRKVNRFLRADVESGKDSPAWQLTTHPADGFLQIITPKPASGQYVQYNQNLQTGAWGFWEGVPIFGAGSWGGDYYMGGAAGVVYINSGVLDGTKIAGSTLDLWQEVYSGTGAGWSTAPNLYTCNGTQGAETKLACIAVQALVAGNDYTFEYTVVTPAPVLPQCVPYSCSAFTEGQVEAGVDYQWLLNDKETQYQGVMIEELTGSTILTAIGNVNNTGEQVDTVVDSCAGITGWRVRPNGVISNSSELRVSDIATAQQLLTDGFSFSASIVPTAEIDTPIFSFSYAYVNPANHTCLVSVAISDPDTVRITVEATGTIPAYTIFVALPSTILVSVPQMMYVEYDNTEIKIWFGTELIMTHIFTNGGAGAAQPLPVPSGPTENALISIFKNSQYLLQNLAIGEKLTTEALAALALSWDRNYAAYVPPVECTGLPPQPAGNHLMRVGAQDITSFSGATGTFSGTFTADANGTDIALVGDSDFVGQITDVSVITGTSADNGEPIEFRALTSFQAPAGHANFNRVGFIRTVGLLAGAASLQVRAVYDYAIETELPVPNPIATSGASEWNTALWDSALWDYSIAGKSFTAGTLGIGRTFAVAVRGSANNRINIISWDCLFQTGGYL